MKIKLQLQTFRKQNLSIFDYFNKMKRYTDELLAIGHHIDNQDLLILFLESWTKV